MGKHTLLLDRPESVEKLLQRFQDLHGPHEREALRALLQGARPPEGEVLRLGLVLGTEEEGKTSFLALAVLGAPGRPGALHRDSLVASARPGLSPREVRELLLTNASRQAFSTLRRWAQENGKLLREWREAYARARPHLPPLPEDLFPVETHSRGPFLFTLGEGRKGGQVFLLAGRGGSRHARLEGQVWEELLRAEEEVLPGLLEPLLGEEARRDPAGAVDRYALLQNLGGVLG